MILLTAPTQSQTFSSDHPNPLHQTVAGGAETNGSRARGNSSGERGLIYCRIAFARIRGLTEMCKTTRAIYRRHFVDVAVVRKCRRQVIVHGTPRSGAESSG